MSVEKAVEVLDRIFNAKSIAVVGASSDPTKFGYMTLDSIIRGGYEGRIYPVNPRGGEILGLRAYQSLGEVPERPELVVIIVPAQYVPNVTREAAEKGAQGAVILSAGFREAGRADLEAEIQSISQTYGIRLIGPNIQGINYLPNKLCAMFFPVITTKGPMAIITQSGSATAALSEWAAYEGLGISAAINLGNQVDLCESDYIDFFSADMHTKVIALYLEGIRDGRQFLESAARAARQKPIAILKSGRTLTGQRAVSSHTGSLAGSHEVFSSACRQFGIISTNDIETLYDCAKALGTMREPRGNRLLSISSSGGMGTLAVDEAESLGLAVPSLPEEFVEELKGCDLSPLASLSNPLDLANISAEDFRKVALLADGFNIADIILLNFGDPVAGAPEMVEYLAGNIKASVAVSYLGGGEEEKVGRIKIQKGGVPVFPTPERAIRGIAAVVEYARYRENRTEQPREIVLHNRKRGGLEAEDRRFLLEPEGIEYLRSYQIPYPDHGLAHSEEEAVDIAGRLGYPVVLKVVSADVPHKTDVNGVAVGLEGGDQVAAHFKRIHEEVKRALTEASVEGVLVCRQAPEGLDVIVGALDDPVFGPTVMFGLGGIFTEVLGDVTFRIAPLERHDAEEMVREIRGYPLLAGVRGRQGYDTEQLTELLMSVSRMVIERPEIRELDLNPVRLFERGLMALDVRVIKGHSFDQEDEGGAPANRRS
ncbi:MAG TPA: acetate--CoA ligase family protein [Desulfatiglandales bacterium]|nr:acetate--CoA ligase family protein [Desulfatiglandales bacterium]